MLKKNTLRGLVLYLFCINGVICHFWVVPLYDGLDRLIILVNKKLQHHEIHDTQSKSHAPKHGMGSNKWAIGECEGRDDHEEDEDSQNAREKI